MRNKIMIGVLGVLLGILVFQYSGSVPAKDTPAPEVSNSTNNVETAKEERLAEKSSDIIDKTDDISSEWPDGRNKILIIGFMDWYMERQTKTSSHPEGKDISEFWAVPMIAKQFYNPTKWKIVKISIDDNCHGVVTIIVKSSTKFGIVSQHKWDFLLTTVEGTSKLKIVNMQDAGIDNTELGPYSNN
jgi:hypothetical protein